MPHAITKVFLLPGEYCVGDASYRIRTLLGSCVSITLWNRRLRVGAMSHFVLSGHSHDGPPNARYGEDALALMLQELRAHGVHSDECEAKIFGGGAMFSSRKDLRIPDIGRRNGEAARRLLLAQGIPILSESLYGEGHRQIMFEVKTGDVWVRHTRLPAEEVAATREREAWASKS